jgi:hypothetical protein
MKKLMQWFLTVGCAVPITAFAADLRPQDLSARPIDNISISRADGAFLRDAAANLFWQSKAIEIGRPFLESSVSIEEANFALKTLQEIQEDLQELAKARDVALPMEGSLTRPRDFERLMNTRNGGFEREYGRYAQRSTRKLFERFRNASTHADDPQVRAFAIRHVRWVEAAHRETRGLPPLMFAGTAAGP